MPATVRLSASDLVTAIRRRDRARAWIDAYTSGDDGHSWSLLGTPEPDTGEGNPPSLVRLQEGRLALVYGVRRRPFGIRARFSADRGKTWSEPFALHDNGGGNDLGYVRSVVRPDGKVVSVYYFHDRPESIRYLAATVWDAGSRQGGVDSRQ
jgi:hypothetical protein